TSRKPSHWLKTPRQLFRELPKAARLIFPAIKPEIGCAHQTRTASQMPQSCVHGGTAWMLHNAHPTNGSSIFQYTKKPTRRSSNSRLITHWRM
ncbi:MAG TPA: hypothetical protein PLS67_14390, partial [Accumulibacter sp.]|nr:hypothetical protein [Accumulibacter sp.]